MKQLNFFSIVSLALICLLGGNQANARATQNFNDTITTAPVGTVIKDGKLMVAKGYKFRLSANGGGTIYRVSDGRVMCRVDPDKCPNGSHVDKNGNIRCNDALTHGWIFSIGEIAMDGKTTWKTLVIPQTRITTSSN